MPTTVTAEDKKAIRRAVLQRLGIEDEGMEDTIDELDQASDIVRDEPIDESEQAQQQIAADMQNLLEESDDQADRDADAARALDFSAKDAVGPGAVVGLSGDRYVVGVVVNEVEVDGQTYSGLSEDSPLYEAVKGLKAGQDYSFQERKGTVDFVA